LKLIKGEGVELIYTLTRKERFCLERSKILAGYRSEK